MTRTGGARLWRWLALLAVCGIALQLYFVVRIALMLVVDPQSTALQRSEGWRLGTGQRPLRWQQQWRDYTAISMHLKRAVVAAEDSGFTEHSGVEWDALEKAWENNLRNEAAMEDADAKPAARRPAQRIVGGSTITQQLAKNLFLGGERSLPRKVQELGLSFVMEAMLGKRRILEIYLNHVEWGEGVFGAEAAAQHYFRVASADLTVRQAARLAVMLPAPKRFEKRPNSAYIAGRAATVMARMARVDVP